MSNYSGYLVIGRDHEHVLTAGLGGEHLIYIQLSYFANAKVIAIQFCIQKLTRTGKVSLKGSQMMK